jgi:hypothetical protein
MLKRAGLIVTCILSSTAWATPAAPLGCERANLVGLFERAWEARDDHFVWEGIDDREAAADLGRFVFRLQRFLDAQAACATEGLDDLARRGRDQMRAWTAR